MPLPQVVLLPPEPAPTAPGTVFEGEGEGELDGDGGAVVGVAGNELKGTVWRTRMTERASADSDCRDLNILKEKNNKHPRTRSHSPSSRSSCATTKCPCEDEVRRLSNKMQYIQEDAVRNIEHTD